MTATGSCLAHEISLADVQSVVAQDGVCGRQVNITVSAGDLVSAEGETFKAANGEEVWLKNAIYPVPDVRAGKSSKVKVNVPGMAYEPPDAAGFWTGPFDMKG